MNHVKCRIVHFWLRILRGKVSKYSYVLLKFISAIHKDEHLDFTSSWLKFTVKTRLIKLVYPMFGWAKIMDCGLNINSLLKLRLNDIFCQEWRVAVYGQIVFAQIIEYSKATMNLKTIYSGRSK